jgi:hypothetical protein
MGAPSSVGGGAPIRNSFWMSCRPTHDVLTLIDGRPEAAPDLRTYIRGELDELRAKDYFDYAVQSATASYGPAGAGRAGLVRTRVDKLLA